MKMLSFAVALQVGIRHVAAFSTSNVVGITGSNAASRSAMTRCFSTMRPIDSGVSRVETLQFLLSKHGAPGSAGCKEANDLESIASIDDAELLNLHPHLHPIARSKSTGNYICALRRAFAEEGASSTMYASSNKAPWPIVETKLGGMGMKVLALNSEHLMRRIVCECDFAGTGDEIIASYNEGLGQEQLNDAALDIPYQRGSVEKLGYGVDKYVLLKVGPFSDIYESLALGHAKGGDESSSLISAEAANGKMTGFGSTFRFYARLLRSFPNREEEARDAARMCLRLPLPSIGMEMDDFREVAVLGQLAEDADSDDDVRSKLQSMYQSYVDHEKDDPHASQGKTPESMAIDEANYLIDTTALKGGEWKEIRSDLAKIYSSVGYNEMAKFVDPSL
uniref:Uncharacterized protein n=1 Tax=Craspedostauros australis TaxID=1486917 RepID=A0A7R9ZLM0_9STRA|eukprot:CAMPEP_0198117386 /NCGR_PEP_ID=MMETSP1442-20131203/17913_1 /TAXON_ID= /ORGANISM="Craspedostauros australis, Strain CCMP3328" /LENGTH=392 /DNA_ID=CAMNT_0043775427 /DNA_START=75 /DNA_END=1253 /DNA_ORIENTATION=-